MKREDINYWLHESPDAKSEAAIDAAARREELIDEKREEMIEQRIEAMSDDDIICALQSDYAKDFLPQIRSAIKEVNRAQAYGVLAALVDLWIRHDSRDEAVKWMELLESVNHPCN